VAARTYKEKNMAQRPDIFIPYIPGKLPDALFGSGSKVVNPPTSYENYLNGVADSAPSKPQPPSK
jgi:hypothetical protein